MVIYKSLKFQKLDFHYFFFYFLNYKKKSLFILKPNLSFLPMQFIIKKLLIILFLIIAIKINQLKVICSK